MPTLAVNRSAKHKYEVLEKYEAGIKLTGAEVKSVRKGQVSLREAFVTLRTGGAWLIDAQVTPYQAQASHPQPNRPRQLLLHQAELARLKGQTAGKNLTIIPRRVYTRGRLIKLEIALARGKKKYEKRAALKKREVEQEIRRTLKTHGDELASTKKA